MSAKPETPGTALTDQQARTKRAKVMANPLRVKILGELTQRPMSAKGFERAFPEYSYQQVYGQFRTLDKLGYIEVAGRSGRGGKRRGTEEIFFRATERAWLDHPEWASLALPVREGGTAETLANLIARISEATAAGTIDKRTDRHVSWTDAPFDKQAWDETVKDCKDLVDKLPDRIAESAVRLNTSGGEEIRATIGLTCFESPKRSRGDKRET